MKSSLSYCYAFIKKSMELYLLFISYKHNFFEHYYCDNKFEYFFNRMSYFCHTAEISNLNIFDLDFLLNRYE